jgi:hypothetical protein
MDDIESNEAAELLKIPQAFIRRFQQYRIDGASVCVRAQGSLSRWVVSVTYVLLLQCNTSIPGTLWLLDIYIPSIHHEYQVSDFDVMNVYLSHLMMAHEGRNM